MNRIIRLFSLLLLMLSMPLATMAQGTLVDGHYVDPKQGQEANPTDNPDYSLMDSVAIKRVVQGKRSGAPIAPAVNYGLPDHVNNGASKYFRKPVTNQEGNSCGITSRHSHMMAYELNAYRDKDGSLAENMLPAHFAFVPAYKEDPNKENYAKYVGIPDGATFGGTNYSNIYGGPYSENSNNYGRMQGYENWHKAMFNRITENPNFPLGAMTEQGALAWKRWLYNHNGDESFHAGGVIGIGLASSGLDVADIASTTANNNAGVTGLKYLTHWGTGVDHAMVIVGYDDRIEFDLDGNGTYGETSNNFGQNETGAWIACNSWGNWQNGGFIYVPYALGSPTSKAVSKTVGSTTYSGYEAGDTNGWTGEIYKIRKDYTPIRTLKAAVAYSKRSEIQICVGISTNLNATTPDKTLVLANHNYHGDYDGDGTDAEVPMLGLWSDGQLHTEAMEFGYDLTDFTNEFNRHVPLKYFLIINTKSGASGSGQIEYASIIDYELNQNGVETPFASKNVTITNNGGTTTISTVVYGEEVCGPDNLTLSVTTLSWDAPQSTSYTPTGYYVYQDGERIGTTTSRTYDIGSATGIFHVTAGLYENNGALSESPASNYVLAGMSSSSFISHIKNPISTTSELTSNMYVMLYNYGRGKYMYDNGANTIYAFTNGDPKVLAPDYYKYVFKVTKSGNSYKFASINGSIPSISSNNQTITPSNSAGSFTVTALGNNLFNIKSSIYLNGNDSNPVGWSSGTDNTSKWIITPVNVSIPGTNTLNVTIADPGTVYAGVPVQLNLEGAADIASATWTVNSTNYTGVSPFVTFSSTGSKTVSCTATDSKGYTKSTSKTITVSSAPTVTANFTLSSESTTGSDRISFLSANTVPGCTYSWSMPGAEETTATTRNASATYLTTGQKTVTLTVTDANNNSYSHSETFMVNASAPKTRYSISPAIIVKYNPVSLTDNSLYTPTSWNWLFESDYNRITCSTQNGTITPTKAGIYKLTYRTENELGYDEVEVERALIVCNSASGQGLTFAGGDQNVTTSLSSALTTAWTIDFWFNPKSLGNSTQGITGSNSNNFTITSDANGVATLTVGSESVTSDKAFYISNEWHHYAITFSSGTVMFYRDGRVISTKSVSATDFSSHFQNLKLGGSSAPMNGSIDEFRVWDTALSRTDICSYCVAPISTSTSGLKLYWQMNQSTGNVTDATSNGIMGTRNNFGPDGDAWTDSDGVFALDLSAPATFNNVDLNSPATTLSTGTWYVMSNHGRGGYLYENNSNTLDNTSNEPGNSSGEPNRYLVCLSNAGNGKYHIETGSGNYIQTLSWGNVVTTGTTKEAFTIDIVNSSAGHFYVQGCSNNVVLDSNAPGSTIVGYGTSVPTTTGGNNCWHFYPVEFVWRPTASETYTINNTNTSRGALIYEPAKSTEYVWSSGKSGATTLNVQNQNHQWVIIPTSTSGQYYLYNVGADRFAIPTGIAQSNTLSWVFSKNAVPVVLESQDDGTYKIKMAKNPVNGTNAAYMAVSNNYTGPIINWNDVGGNFTITAIPGINHYAAATAAVAKLIENQTPLTTYPQASGWYAIQIESKTGADSYAGRYLQNNTSLYNGLYPLTFTGGVDIHPSIADPTFLTYIDHTSWNVNTWQMPDGRYLVDNGSNKFPTPSTTAGNVICGYDGGNYFKTGNNYFADPYNSGSTYFIGETTSKRTSYKVYPIDLSAAGLTAWQVLCDNAPESAQITCTRSDVSGLTSVYKNGYFFLPTGVTPTSTDFTMDGVGSVTIDETNKTITLAYILDVLVKHVNDGYYTTIYSPYALVLPTDADGQPIAKAYAGSVGDGVIRLTPFENNILPAFQGALVEFLYDPNNPIAEADFHYNFAISSESGTIITGNRFTGVLADTNPSTFSPSVVLTFGRSGGELGFFKYTGATLKAGKAFLLLTSDEFASLSRGLALDFTTGIQEMEDGRGNMEDGSVYDLQGRKLSTRQSSNGQLPKGLYIINGKKTLK